MSEASEELKRIAAALEEILRLVKLDQEKYQKLNEKNKHNAAGPAMVRVLLIHADWLRDNGYKPQAASAQAQAASLTRKFYCRIGYYKKGKITYVNKRSKKIIISLSKPEKMPGYAYGLPAWECKTGGKLAKVPGSVCFGCYAMKGNYTRFPAIRESQYKRLAALQDPRWVDAMATMLNSQAVSKHKVFRWHDAGDVQNLDHLNKIFEVCRLTPGMQHWMPTREAWIRDHLERCPKNLIIRLSMTMIDQAAAGSWPHTSTVTTKPGARTCPAPDQGGKCGSCRQCWSHEVINISYGKH